MVNSGSAAAAAIARAMGCSEAFSSAAASRSNSAGSTPWSGSTACRFICSVVTVPVLSSTTVSTRRVEPSTSGPLMRMPELGAATGADYQRGGRGQAEGAGAGAGDDQDGHGGGERGVHRLTQREYPGHPVGQALHLGLAVLRVGDHPGHLRELSARPDMGSAHDDATADVRGGPGDGGAGGNSTAADSPVSMLASTAEDPSTTTPSVAIFLPGRTTKLSPTSRASTGTRCSTPPRESAKLNGIRMPAIPASPKNRA